MRARRITSVRCVAKPRIVIVLLMRKNSMMLNEVLHDFFNGKKIYRKSWDEGRYFYWNNDNTSIINQNNMITCFYGQHFACDDWELFEEGKEDNNEIIEKLKTENLDLKCKIYQLEIEKKFAHILF